MAGGEVLNAGGNSLRREGFEDSAQLSNASGSSPIPVAEMLDVADTIAAIASARDGGLRGIVRVSGPQAMECLAKLLIASPSPVAANLSEPVVLTGPVRCQPPIGDVPCDVYVWPTRRSYTRQPCFEIHTFGSPPILDAMLAAACGAGARLAEPGEFTMRAFLAGRIDLTQAEAVLGVIDSRQDADLRIALRQLAGGLSRPLHTLRERLLDVLAHLEAGLDFVEEDIEFIEQKQLEQELEAFLRTVAELLEQISKRGETQGTPRVVCVGWPNAGKSSLFNALTGDAVSIVSNVEGTTRDYVIRRVLFNGMDVVLADTAGFEIQERSTGVSAASQAMRQQQSEQASLCLLCLDASRPMNQWELEQIASHATPNVLTVITKNDLPRRCEFSGPAIATSSRTGQGIAELREAIKRRLESSIQAEASVVSGTAIRCRESLVQAQASLERAIALVRGRGDEELVAAELRQVLDELGTVVGAVYTDDILDRIFSRFCIGK